MLTWEALFPHKVRSLEYNMFNLSAYLFFNSFFDNIFDYCPDVAKLKSLEVLDLSYDSFYDGVIPLQGL